jgi:uncharacterized protein (TIGR03067 family)
MRRVVVCALLAGVAGFAPAPLPRPSRRGPDPSEVSLRALAGTWRVVSFVHTRNDGNHVHKTPGFDGVTIQGDDWTFVADSGVTYLVTLDGKKKPAALDFWTGRGLREEEPLGKGIVRRRGDVVEVLYSFQGERRRAAGFDPPPAGMWLLTLRRGR